MFVITMWRRRAKYIAKQLTCYDSIVWMFRHFRMISFLLLSLFLLYALSLSLCISVCVHYFIDMDNTMHTTLAHPTHSHTSLSARQIHHFFHVYLSCRFCNDVHGKACWKTTLFTYMYVYNIFGATVQFLFSLFPSVVPLYLLHTWDTEW